MKRNVLRGTLVAALIGTSVLAVPASAEEAKSEEAKSYEIGMTVADLTNPIWAEVCDEVQKKGEEMGSTFTVVAANNDPSTQVAQIEDFIQQKKDAIIVSAIDINSVESAIKDAQDVTASIPTHMMYPIQMIMQVQDS